MCPQTGQGLAKTRLEAFSGFLWAFPRSLQVEISGSCPHQRIRDRDAAKGLSETKITSKTIRDKGVKVIIPGKQPLGEGGWGSTASLWKP